MQLVDAWLMSGGHRRVNKMARIAWALLASGGHYRPRLAAA
jgi:hypothetical protein